MGLWDTLKQHAGAQFLDVIEWLDDSSDTVVWRFPVFNQAITDQSKLIVREGQAAVFVAEGRLSDVFGPGTYTLDTRNQPLMAFFQSIAYQLSYPYKGDIYFVNTRHFRENRWGTSNPFMMRDAEFGPVRVRAFGIYAFRVTDPAGFLRKVVGTDGLFTTDEITGHVKRKLVSALADAIGKSRIAVLDLAAHYMDLGDQLRDGINPILQESFGISLSDFVIENISLPEEVEKALDTRTKMGVLGDLNAYTQLKAADAIESAARNPGLGGAGMGMGVGFGMGNMVGGQMANAMGGGGRFDPQRGMQAPPPPPGPGGHTLHYHGPSGQAQLPLQEIVQRVAADRAADHMLWAPGWPGWKSWREVPEVANAVPPQAAPPPVEARFHYHGPGGEGEKSLGEIAAIVAADPEGAHHVWKEGFDGWKPATEVPEIQQALARTQGPPPPPGGGGGPPPPPE